MLSRDLVVNYNWLNKLDDRYMSHYKTAYIFVVTAFC